MTDGRDGSGFSASEYSFFVDRDIVLLAIHNVCDDTMEKEWEKHWAIYNTCLSKYQEQPLLLNPSLEELMTPLCERLLHLSSFLVGMGDDGGSSKHPAFEMKVTLPIHVILFSLLLSLFSFEYAPLSHFFYQQIVSYRQQDCLLFVDAYNSLVVSGVINTF